MINQKEEENEIDIILLKGSRAIGFHETIMLYECETWIMKQNHEKKIDLEEKNGTKDDWRNMKVNNEGVPERIE